ncbi:hypothetical protein ACFX16_006898 [Malus domestica]
MSLTRHSKFPLHHCPSTHLSFNKKTSRHPIHKCQQTTVASSDHPSFASSKPKAAPNLSSVLRSSATSLAKPLHHHAAAKLGYMGSCLKSPLYISSL